MNLRGPYIYEVAAKGEDSYSVAGPDGATNFLAPVTAHGPKLYVFSDNGKPIYIGQTLQVMSARMLKGFKAHGESGYWGYHWRKILSKATLHIWLLEGITEKKEQQAALERIESEFVFLYRSTYDQWPKYQTEIHFHESTNQHRKLAKMIFQTFRSESE